MTESLKHTGLLQPIIVRRNGTRYQIIAGERRWQAAKLAGLSEVPVIVRDTADKKLLLESFIENIQREDLTSVEREDAIYELWQSGQYTSQRDLARALGYRTETIEDIIEAKEFRNRVPKLPDSITTTQIAQTQGLDDNARLSVLDKIEKGELKQVSSQVELREAVQILKKARAAQEGLRKRAR
jgi:ParB family transcriptional regulator, chromosome partitioning protein